MLFSMQHQFFSTRMLPLQSFFFCKWSQHGAKYIAAHNSHFHSAMILQRNVERLIEKIFKFICVLLFFEGRLECFYIIYGQASDAKVLFMGISHLILSWYFCSPIWKYIRCQENLWQYKCPWWAERKFLIVVNIFW